MQFSFCSRHHPPTCTKRLIATHFGAPRPLSSATALGCNRSRSQSNTLPPSSEGAGTGWSMDFQTDEPHWVIQSASLLSAPSTEDHQTATALCSYCMRKRPEGRGLWREKTKTRKSTKLFFFFTPVKQTNNKKQLCFPPLNNTNKNKPTTILQSDVTQISPIRLHGLQCDGGGRVSLVFTVWTEAEVSLNATHLS